MLPNTTPLGKSTLGDAAQRTFSSSLRGSSWFRQSGVVSSHPPVGTLYRVLRKRTPLGSSLYNKISMKIKIIVTILLVAFILVACTPVANVILTETAIPTNTLSSTETPAPTRTSLNGLQAVNGTHLYYEIIGKGAPLFVLHGAGGSHRYFLPYMEALSDEYQLIFYDQRGTGLSDGQLDPAAISIDQFVEDLEALRVAFGFEKISLMGHSWGTIIALAYAVKYQTHLDHLILVDSIPVNNKFLIEFSNTLQQRIQHLSADAQHELTTTCANSSAELSPKVIDECNRLEAQLRFYAPAKAPVAWAMDKSTLKNNPTVHALMNNSFNKMQHNIDTQLPTIHVPTLIVHGDFDPIPLASSEYLHEQIPRSQIVVITESGHFPFIEQPEQFVAALRAFLSN
jgi:proline iminopeptidase